MIQDQLGDKIKQIDKEATEPVLTECLRLGTSLHEALSFRDNIEKLNTPMIEINKRRLKN